MVRVWKPKPTEWPRSPPHGIYIPSSHGGLDPAIHLSSQDFFKLKDARVKPGHDDLRRWLSPQIRRLDLLVVGELVAVAVHDDVAAFQHIGALYQRQSAADVLLDEQDRGAHLVDLADLLEGDIGHDGRQSERGLVQHQ